MVEDLVERYPRIYHMAFAECYESIQANGLLSTQALVDLCGLQGEEREAILRRRRADVVRITCPAGPIAIRDQKPISESKLAKCLEGGLTPEDWYEKLNERVFFWVKRRRAQELLEAGAYASERSDVYVLDTARLISDYADRIELAAMNTGATRPMARARGPSTFQKLETYPYDVRKQKGLEPVIEFTVLSGVQNALEYVIEIERWEGGKCVKVLTGPLA